MVMLRLIRSGVWKADWHVLDETRQAGDGWCYTLCGLMLRAVEEVPMDLVDGHRPGCPLCLAGLSKHR